MPELPKSMRYKEALAELSEHLESLGDCCRKLELEELKARSSTKSFLQFSDGWRINIPCSDGAVEVEYLLDHNFPYSPPKLALVSKPDDKKLPHVFTDGSLCLMPNHGEVSPFNPVAVFDEMLTEAHTLISDGSSGALDGDYDDEFLSYWRTGVVNPETPILSLLSCKGKTRHVSLVRGAKEWIVAEDQADGLRWLKNRRGTDAAQKSWTRAVYVWLEQPPSLKDFDSTNRSLLEWLDGLDGDGKKVVKKALKKPNCLVVFGFDTGNGVALAGVFVTPRKPTKKVKSRQTAIISQLANTDQTKLLDIQRIDHAWVHGRGYDYRSPILSEKKVVVIGCGSVGSAVTKLLAEAGVGTLDLIDPDNMSWANIGRHVLGADCVGKQKADALAQTLQTQFPHLHIASHGALGWQEVYAYKSSMFDDADLIISATGSWQAEAQLNDLALTKGENFPTIVYGWTEPFGVAGHAVVIPAGKGCFACGFDAVGRPHHTVVDWKDVSQLKQEPACGTSFQPYGPIELSYVNTVIANAGLEVLISGSPTEACRSVWVARKSYVSDAGGEWSAKWSEIFGDRQDGGQTISVPWSPEKTCMACRGKHFK